MKLLPAMIRVDSEARAAREVPHPAGRVPLRALKLRSSLYRAARLLSIVPQESGRLPVRLL